MAFGEMSKNVQCVCKFIAHMGFVRPTLIQYQSLPLAAELGRDLLVRDHTGSGKILLKVSWDKEEEMNNDDGSYCDDYDSDD